jgi:hypothetical protein
MSGGYILPNGEFQEDTSLETSSQPLPVDSVCGAAEQNQSQQTEEGE